MTQNPTLPGAPVESPLREFHAVADEEEQKKVVAGGAKEAARKVRELRGPCG